MVQLAGTVLPTFHAPDWAQQVFVVFVALGFPIGLVLAWGFVEGGSLKGLPDHGGIARPANSLRVWVLGALGVFVALLALTAYWFGTPGKREGVQRMAVPRFPKS